MACISKSVPVPRDIKFLSDCHPQWLRSAVDVTRNSVADHSASLSCILQDSQVRKVVLSWYCFCMWFLVEKGCRSHYFNKKMGLLRNALLVNQKKSGSCRCVCRKSHIGQSSCDDVNCFSNGCCNVGSLVDTLLWPLSVSLEVLGSRVFPRCKGHPKLVTGRPYHELYDCVVGLLAPSQRYRAIEKEEACQLWPEKKWLLEKVKEGVVVVPKRKLWAYD
jgi:hypothetical protein